MTVLSWFGCLAHNLATSGAEILTRQSAGTCEPDASSTRSPGTRAAASRVCQTPSRRAVACGRSDALSARTASPALVVSYLRVAAGCSRPTALSP